jgi:hypothetical protein
VNEELIYRVKFREQDQGAPTEVLVKNVYPSDIPGLVCLSGFVFKDNTKRIILPEEDAASKRFRKTKSLHIPYHNILFVEETTDEPIDIKNLPFLKEVKDNSIVEKPLDLSKAEDNQHD